MPASAAIFAQASASNCAGFHCGWNFSYSSTGMRAVSRIHSPWFLLPCHSPAGIA